MYTPVRRENLAFLLGGFAFGLLFGFGIYRTAIEPPVSPPGGAAPTESAMPSPAGPMAPTQTGPDARGLSPVMGELNQLRQRLEEDPEDLSALVQLGDLLFQIGMWSEAVRFYERGLEVSPEDPDLLTVSGLCYREMRQFDKALGRFNEAHRLDPSHWQSLYNTALVAGLDLGQFDQAEAALLKLESGFPSNPRLRELRKAITEAREKVSASPPST